MKKIISFILLVVFSISIYIGNVNAVDLPEKTDREPVKVYLFRGEGCGACYSFLEYFSEEAYKYEDYFEIIAYETWKNSANANLKSIMDDSFEIAPDDRGVPLIVIGDYYRVGFNTATADEIIETALESYESGDSTDLVAQTIKDENIEANSETFKEACESEGIKVVSENDNSAISDELIVGIIFVVIIGGFILLLATSKKKA